MLTVTGVQTCALPISELLRHTSETRSSSHARRKVAKQTPDRFMVDTSWLMSMVDTFMVDTSCLIVSWLTLSWLTLHAHIVSWLTLHQKHSTHGSVSYVQRHTSETRSSSHARRKVAKQTPDHTNSGMKVKGQSRTADLRVSGITPQHSRLDIRSES